MTIGCKGQNSTVGLCSFKSQLCYSFTVRLNNLHDLSVFYDTQLRSGVENSYNSAWHMACRTWKWEANGADSSLPLSGNLLLALFSFLGYRSDERGKTSRGKTKCREFCVQREDICTYYQVIRNQMFFEAVK